MSKKILCMALVIIGISLIDILFFETAFSSVSGEPESFIPDLNSSNTSTTPVCFASDYGVLQSFIPPVNSSDMSKATPPTCIPAPVAPAKINNTKVVKAVAKTTVPEYMKLRTLYNAGKRRQAIQQAVAYLIENQRDGDVRLVLGQFYMQQKQYNLAYNQFQRALIQTPAYTEVRLALINVLIARHQYARAQQVLDTGLRMQKKNAALIKAQFDIYYNFGQNYLQQKQYNSAYRQFKGALALKPLNTDVRITLINILIVRHQYVEAQQILDAGLRIQKKNAALIKAQFDIYYNWGHYFFQQKQYNLAYNQFKRALALNPLNTDARMALINILVVRHQYVEAQQVLDQGLRIQAGNVNLIKAQINLYYESGQYYFQQKQYNLAYKQLEQAVTKKPTFIDARIALINVLIEKYQYAQAQKVLNDGFRIQANADLLSTQANLYYERGRFHQSAVAVKEALKLSPNNKIAANVKSNLDSISPRYMIGPNTIGIYTQNLYASDLHQNWDYTTLYYGRDTNMGYIIGKINYDSRFKTDATQAEIEAFPVLNRYVYFDLDATYANQPILFPNYSLGAEAYLSVPNIFDFSFGGKFNKITNNKAYTYYTGSISKQIGNNVFIFRPYYYKPSAGASTVLYTGQYRYYLHSDPDNYVNVIGGIGRSPDLDNLLAADFIIMDNKFINLSLFFPVLAHTVLINIGAEYNHQYFPSSRLVRNLTGGTVGILKRF